MPFTPGHASNHSTQHFVMRVCQNAAASNGISTCGKGPALLFGESTCPIVLGQLSTMAMGRMSRAHPEHSNLRQEGIYVRYSNGDRCAATGGRHSFTVNVMCGPETLASAVSSASWSPTDACHLDMVVRSPYGCPHGAGHNRFALPMNWFSVLAVASVFTVLLYVGIQLIKGIERLRQEPGGVGDTFVADAPELDDLFDRVDRVDESGGESPRESPSMSPEAARPRPKHQEPAEDDGIPVV